MLCTDEKDIEEWEGMYGPLCWQGYDKDPGDFKKLMWHGIMKECEVEGHFHVVRVRESERKCFRAQTFEPR